MARVTDLLQTIEIGRSKVIRHRRELLADGQPIDLGGRAFDTLMALIGARGTVLSKLPERLVAGASEAVVDNALDHGGGLGLVLLVCTGLYLVPRP